MPRIGTLFGSQYAKSRRKRRRLSAAASFALNSNLEIHADDGQSLRAGFRGRALGRRAETLPGPIGIVQIISQVVRERRFCRLISILGLISLNLGIFNLLPIPMLDGGQIMVLGIEKVYQLVRQNAFDGGQGKNSAGRFCRDFAA